MLSHVSPSRLEDTEESASQLGSLSLTGQSKERRPFVRRYRSQELPGAGDRCLEELRLWV